MSDTVLAYPGSDPHRLRSMAGIVEHAGPASKRIVTGYGFWIFILSDMVMFSAFFATYAVLLGQTAGGPSGRDLFDLRNVAIETGFLLGNKGVDERLCIGRARKTERGVTAVALLVDTCAVHRDEQPRVGIVLRHGGNARPIEGEVRADVNVEEVDGLAGLVDDGCTLPDRPAVVVTRCRDRKRLVAQGLLRPRPGERT